MKKNVAIGIAAAAITGAMAYLYKRKQSRKEAPTPEVSRSRHRTDVFSKAKPQRNPIE